MKKIYIAEDDKLLCDLLVSRLKASEYDSIGFENGKQLLDKFKTIPCDLIITDIMMPQMNGYDLCREVRKISDVPIIMVSANNDEIDRVLGLELGSDDYIGKPISFRELLIKIKNIFRRTDKSEITMSVNIVAYQDLKIDLSSREVFVDKQLLYVTAMEFELLELFLRNINRAYSREQIIALVWKSDFDGDTRQVDNLIKRLRKKMIEANAACQIKTVWGFGYKIGGE